MKSRKSHREHSRNDAALVWFRRDLRDFDHTALHAALAQHREVHCVFVFDTEILDALASSADRRVTFIWESVRELKAALESYGGGLHVLHGRARSEIPRLARSLGVNTVHVNRDYEPLAIARDAAVAQQLEDAGIRFILHKDQVIFEAGEVLTRAGGTFSVFTPYKKAWLRKLQPEHISVRETHDLAHHLAATKTTAMPSLNKLGFKRTNLSVPPGMSGGSALWSRFRQHLCDYATQRNIPALAATSQLSAHLRFGTVSIRELVRYARSRRSKGAQTWLSELIWRDFYFAILSSRPDVVDHAFQRSFDALQWNTNKKVYHAWCQGQTGYPLVDAAMRELNETGMMHNRLRMVTASFLVKDLGVDWRRGEHYFAEKLLDYDLAANNGGWQWCASTGCDAQPWFRIFNPVSQSRRFDPDGTYIKRWLPELARVLPRRIHAPWEMTTTEQRDASCMIGQHYPRPVVHHEEARQLALARYRAVKTLTKEAATSA